MKSLYYMPKHMINNDVKIFNPQDWTIKNFEIGRHIGKGKYSLLYLDMDMFIWLAREKLSI